jgi:malonate transporter and related proteins
MGLVKGGRDTQDADMFIILTSILPIFLIIALGLALRKGGIPSTEFWNLNDKLVYWVLLPCLMFNKISVASLGAAPLVPYAVTILGGFFAAVAFAMLAARLFRFASPTGTSILQGSVRHNSFIGLAMAFNLYGAAGFEIAIIATAILVPVSNVVVVVLMVIALQPGRRGNLAVAVLRDLVRNPHIISIALALIANQYLGGKIPVLHEVTGLLGAAALPVTLLSVGANLQIRAMVASALPLILAFTGKMMVFPAAAVSIGIWMGLPQQVLQIVIIYSVVPTGVASYTLARQLGGDAPVMAAIVTLQTLLALFTIPISLMILLPLA